MRFQLVALVLMAVCFYLSTAQVSWIEDCCLKYVKVKHHHTIQKNAISYREQTTGGSCNLHAIVLNLKRATICVNPNDRWVKNTIAMIKDKKHRRRCRGHAKPCKYLKH
ncbi:C-C motif chemokine 25b [Chiloscyllium plagiosum]|uniref:C-C motif chemokine 25b n=1 Tax=Chiloscyllium plagiosum TaxID=36176 RepID=UPI001CB7DED6|nr:C-C motif chemokine 25b [Chiloscyllium plagiosum]XP_043577006.1 C-C motif chemokine 25b [Chiloscyllium plagiosum]